MKKINRTFSPIFKNKGLTPNEYKDKYPELDERSETRHLRGIELIWCWYYGSKESPYKIYKHNEKCRMCTELVFDTIKTDEFYEENKIQLLRDGVISDQKWYVAIDFFKSINTDKRVDAKLMVEKIYEDYKTIVDEGIEGFRNKDDDIDYTKYSNTMKMIKNELPELINTIEKGYGTSVLMSHGENIEEGQYWCEQYIKNKR